jgi:uracil-DNA glycosylase family 4
VDNISYNELVEELAQALKGRARDKQRLVTISKDTAALLNGITASDDGDSLEKIAEEVAACQRCPLHETRLNTVPGEGHPRAKIVFVGEAPGASEDKQGRPFVGRAGQLLTDIISKGMKMSRDDVYICNVLKCRPPDNRNPNPDEVSACEPYLQRQLALLQPRVICALGAVAAHCLLKRDDPLGSMRGKWHEYQGIPLRVTYHPAYLLRQPDKKQQTWEDIKAILRYLEEHA